jgi:hypothetical protein
MNADMLPAVFTALYVIVLIGYAAVTLKIVDMMAERRI